jgi:hypothetical protein
MWRAALGFDLNADNRFWTAARLPVLGAISDEARLWRRHGSGESRLDRWLWTHPTASPEQVLQAQQRLVKRPVFHSLQEAAEGIKQFWAWASNPEFDFEEETTEAAPGSFRSMYDCFDPYQLSYSYSDSDGMAAPREARLSYLKIHEGLSLVVDRLSGGLDTGPDVGNASKPKTPREPLDCSETAVVRFKNGKRQVARQKAAGPGYRIEITPALQAKAKEDFEFAVRRWQSRTRRGPLPAKEYSRWSTKFGAGRAEHENKQIIPAYVPITRFTWKVEYRGAAGDILSVLESPSWHCLKPTPCEFCEEARGRSRSHNVALPSIPSRRAVGRRTAAVDIRSENSRTKPRTAETRLEEEKCQTQFAKQIATTRREKPYSSSPPGLPRRPLRTSRSN